MRVNLTINATVNTVEFAASGHANQMKFKGVLVNLDTPSTKPPNGSQGKRILIPSATAQAALHTLKDMGVNYTDKLDGHNPRRKVGVIKKAWIEGSNIHVSGIIWKKDFPEAETDLKKKDLGMSFEATEIGVEDENAPVWKITRMCFTGASILYKKDAAYQSTEAIAAAKLKSAASQITIINGGISMAHKEKIKVPAKKHVKKVSANADGDSMAQLVAGMTDAFKTQAKQFGMMAGSLNSLRAELHVMAARDTSVETDGEESESIEAAGEESESQEQESESIEAAGFPPKKKKGASESESESMDDESMSAEGSDDEGDLEKLEEDAPDEDDEPGKLNKQSKQKGSQTKVEDKIGKQVNDPILGSSVKKLMKAVNALTAGRAEDRKTIAKLQKKLSAQSTQIKAAASRVERRSISGLGRTLLAKAGIDADSLEASGKKLTVAEVDEILATAKLDPTQRMDIKSQFARSGHMEEGIISRTQVN